MLWQKGTTHLASSHAIILRKSVHKPGGASHIRPTVQSRENGRIHSSCSASFLTLTQCRIESQGILPRFQAGSSQSLRTIKTIPPADVPTGQPDLNNPWLRLSLQTIVCCVELTIKSDHHSWVLYPRNDSKYTGKVWRLHANPASMYVRDLGGFWHSPMDTDRQLCQCA